MSLKIIAGTYGGRVLKSVRGLGTRPLLGQVKGAIFNILQDQVEGALVWDLFAGTGATGLEALSRGARRVAFCEKNGRALDVLRDNLRMLGPEAMERAVPLRVDAWDPPVMHRGLFGAARDAATGEGEGEAGAGVGADAGSDAEVAPDLIFLDPPYAAVEEDPAKSLFRARQLTHRLAPGGCLVFHFPTGMLDEDDFDHDLDVDLRIYGNSGIAFLWRKGEGRARRKSSVVAEVTDVADEPPSAAATGDAADD